MPTSSQAQDSSGTQTVTVTGSAAQARRDEVSGKQIVTAEELAKHGDTRLADALRRVPGITLGGSGAELQIRLDGMSAEQTLVLLNGEPVPRGQVLEALALGMVERIEIVRGANVQWSGRGLAAPRGARSLSGGPGPALCRHQRQRAERLPRAHRGSLA